MTNSGNESMVYRLGQNELATETIYFKKLNRCFSCRYELNVAVTALTCFVGLLALETLQQIHG